MNRLGHEKFYVHGSDWGAIVVSALATLFPQHTKGLHSNFCTPLRLKTMFRYFLGALWPSLFVEEEFISTIYTPLDLLWFINGEIAYLHLMGTKPDTIGKYSSNQVILVHTNTGVFKMLIIIYYLGNNIFSLLYNALAPVASIFLKKCMYYNFYDETSTCYIFRQMFFH